MKKLFFLILLLALIITSFGQNFSKLDEKFRLNQLEPTTGKVREVFDTYTYNEVDDQFALAYAYLSKEN